MPLPLLRCECSSDAGGGDERVRWLKRELGEAAVGVAVDLLFVGGWEVRRWFLEGRERLMGGGESVRDSGRGSDSEGWHVMVGWRARSGLEWA